MRRGKKSSKKPELGIKLAIWGGQLGYWGAFTPEILNEDRMLGGAETAMIYVSKGLARLGYNVTVFYSHVDKPGVYDGVKWVSAKQYNPHECYDVFISWDGADIFNYYPCAHLKILELQCNHPKAKPQHEIDWYTPKSEWHKGRICQYNENILPEHCYIMPNGVDLARYAKREKRIPGRIVWCSSPDRGLHHLLRMWPRIREQVPEATLHIFYEFEKNFEGRKWAMDYAAQNMWFIKTHLNQPGVTFRGGVGQKTLAREQMQAQLLVYPCDPPIPSEGFCITILECLAAGTPAIISDADCLPELWSQAAAMLPLPINDDQWVATIVQFLRDEKLWKEYSRKGLKLAPTYSWERVVRRWDAFIREKLAEKKA